MREFDVMVYDAWLTSPPEPSEVWYEGDCELCGDRTYGGDNSVVLDYVRYCEDCGKEELARE